MKQATKSVYVEKISFTDHNLLKNLCGEHDKNLKFIENLEPVDVKAWGNHITISGKDDNVRKISYDAATALFHHGKRLAYTFLRY